MASCCYHSVGAAPSSSSSSCVSIATTPTLHQSLGLTSYLPGGGDGGLAAETLDLEHHPGGVAGIDVLEDRSGLESLIGYRLKHQDPKLVPSGSVTSLFSAPTTSPYAGLVSSGGGITQGRGYAPGNMTQLMTLPHANPHANHQQQAATGNIPTASGQLTRDSSCSIPARGAVPPQVTKRNNATSTETQKKKRAGCKSSYKHVPHREKAPHLVARRNARERRRVQAVNTAFVRLRRHVPHENRHKRLSKVKTLHFAIDYINYMQRMINEYDAAVLRAGGGGVMPGGRGMSGAGGGGGGHIVGAAGGVIPGLGAEPHPSCRLQSAANAVDMVELNSTKENRWMPVNLPPPHGADQSRGLFLTPDAYGQYHQG